MKMKILGIVIIALAIIWGLYVGGYLCFIKGIIDMVTGIIAIISACSAGTVIPAGTAWLIGLGIIKFSVSAIIGFGIFLFVGLIGAVFMGAGEDSISKKKLAGLKRSIRK